MTKIKLVLLLLGLGCAGCKEALLLSTDAQLVDPSTLSNNLAHSMVIDVRSQAEFMQGHIPGSLNLTIEEMNGYLSRVAAKDNISLVLVCHSGIRAILAFPTAYHHGHTQARVLDGGIERWKNLGLPLESRVMQSSAISTTLAYLPVNDQTTSTPVWNLTRFQQSIIFASGGIIKPIYLLISILLVIVLIRTKSLPLKIIRAGLVCFFAGELFCAINYYWPKQGCAHPIDLLHGAGMAAMSALIPWGFFRLFDEHVLRFSDPTRRCAIQTLCGHCWKQSTVKCGPHYIMLFALGAFLAISLIPLSSQLFPTLVTMKVFGSDVENSSPIVNQIIELRLYPVIGAFLFLLAFISLLRGPKATRSTEPLFFSGLGFMTFSLLRHFLMNSFRGNIYWSDFWEEITELFLVVGIGLVLIMFRQQLGLGSKQSVNSKSQEVAVSR